MKVHYPFSSCIRACNYGLVPEVPEKQKTRRRRLILLKGILLVNEIRAQFLSNLAERAKKYRTMD